MTTSSVRIGRLGSVAVCCLLAGGCGKKGPPLVPYVRIPSAVETITATRVGDDVYVTVSIPTENVDGLSPADLDRVEVYGYTGRVAPPRGRFVEFGARIATVPVARPVDGVPSADIPAQGSAITVLDTLSADELVESPVTDQESTVGEPGTGNVEPRTANLEPGTGTGTQNTNPEPGTRNEEPRSPPLRRFYTAYPFSPRNRPAPPGAVAEVSLLPLPDPPPHVEVSYTERDVTVGWDPSGGLIGFLLERPLAAEALPPSLEGAEGASVPGGSPDATGPVHYNVYRAVRDPLSPPGNGHSRPWRVEPPSPVNARPLTELTFSEPVEFGVERCYTVRALRGSGAEARAGRASPEVCLPLLDTFAPAPPRSLAAIASDGGISLIWEPNQEMDLGGYVVLRAEAPGATLQPLVPAPIADARYRDDAVTPGVRYVYAVVALDTRFPLPNVSAESNRVEETAR